MDSKIFLRKYRVSAEEMEAMGEPGDSPLVYEGEEIDSGKKMRLEVVPAAALKMAVREQLKATAIAAKKLNHANIPALHDFGVQDDDLVYVTEDLDGTLANDWVNTHGPMPVGPVLRIASQVVSALGAAAFHRIVHRAINPSNLVLVPGQTAQGEWPLVKVMHFVGGAPMFQGIDTSASAFDNSLPYASPEQLKHGVVDFRSEMYSLGGTLWFLLTGTPPPMAAKGPMTSQPETTELPADKMSAMPKEVRHLLVQMLSANPDARPRDPLAFYQRLQDCLIQVERPETMSRKLGVPVSRTHATGPPKTRTPLITLARAALLLAMAALAALVLRESARPRRVVRAEKSIRAPVGVTAAFSSTTPVTTMAADTTVRVAAPPTAAVTAWNSTQFVPVKSTADARPPATNFVEYAATKQVAVVPVLTISDPPASLKHREKSAVTASYISLPPAAINSSELATTPQVELAPTPAKPRDGETRAVVSQSGPKKNIVHEVRRAEPAELAHPEEKPAAVAPNATPTVSPQSSSAIQAEEAKREATGRSRKAKRPDSEPTPPIKVPQ